MTTVQIVLIKKTWKIFRSVNPNTIGDLFYSKLFAGNPALRKIFPANMQQQHQNLVDTLNTLIIRLDKLQELNEELEAIAKQHVQYGVRPAHYKMAGIALLWTLQKGLGEDWNEEVENAWWNCYNTLTGYIINRAKPVQISSLFE
jgi:hemoglobin-like flavoprotein